MGKGYVLVEGHGEVGAVDNLISRLSIDVGGIKEWLTAHFPPGRSYKPTLDQLPLTRVIDFSMLREAGLACFGTLERALVFLARGTSEDVYPFDGVRESEGEAD